jgi:hypothetical protein
MKLLYVYSLHDDQQPAGVLPAYWRLAGPVLAVKGLQVYVVPTYVQQMQHWLNC